MSRTAFCYSPRIQSLEKRIRGSREGGGSYFFNPFFSDREKEREEELKICILDKDNGISVIVKTILRCLLSVIFLASR